MSRSSGTVFPLSRRVMQILPVMQMLLLIFFYLTAKYEGPWYDMTLLVPCFVVGLLGGGVYVNAFTHLAKDIPEEGGMREVAMGAASVADSFGIMLSNVIGLIMQSCLYREHNIDGAHVNFCPW